MITGASQARAFSVCFQARASQYSDAWDRSIEAMKAMGGTCVEVDYAPFQEADAVWTCFMN